MVFKVRVCVRFLFRSIGPDNRVAQMGMRIDNAEPLTVLPLKSTRIAPGGTRIPALLSTSRKRPFSTRIAEFGMVGPPSPEIRRAFSKKTAGEGSTSAAALPTRRK